MLKEMWTRFCSDATLEPGKSRRESTQRERKRVYAFEMACVCLQRRMDEAAGFEALDFQTMSTTAETVEARMSATARRNIRMSLFLRLRSLEQNDDVAVCGSDEFSTT
ncbi:hypothetical protein ACFX1Q_010690 [Malus domestica]